MRLKMSVKSSNCFICHNELNIQDETEIEFGICRNDLYKIIDMIKNSAFMFGALR